MAKISLPWGESENTLEIPERWQVLASLEPAALPGTADPIAEAQTALQSPAGSARLSQVAQGRRKIALVIDDGSRPTPVARLFPAVIAELQAGGVALEQITVVPAYGVHRPMQDEEVAARIGQQWFEKLHWESHDCDDHQRMHNLGTTSRGTPVWINKTVAEADLVVSIGCIEPHIIASFGGGYKNIIPGVAGRETIAHNHAINCKPNTFNMVGQPIENNPMRLDLEEGAAMLPMPVFIINAVLNSKLEVVKVVCGDPLQAHRAGCQISARIYGAKAPRMADLVIAASHPMDQDLRQGVKALANMIRAMKPGGMMIVTIRAEEGVGVFGLANKKLPVGKKLLKILAPLLLPLVPKLKLSGMGEEDKFFLYFALQTMLRGKVYLYAPTIPQEIHERLPFVEFVDSLEEAMRIAEQRFPGAADVILAPHAGMTYPIIG
ncbi:MAG: hypothetical protein CVU39_20120 [Chloroflexi bacterium HGW-Chloroflexi-10]|nr:MAG: hypothetical protein CVU39_20120 [Chloroflexi bacterium HGW-Chloroflexi-10]